MGKGEHLGEFEQTVLLGLAASGQEAHGRSVYEEIVRATGRDVSVTAVHVTLARLEKKGYLAARMGVAEDTPDARQRKLYRLEAAGVEALRATRQAFDELWRAASTDPRLRQG